MSERLFRFGNSHSIVKGGSGSLSCVTTPHPSCFFKSSRSKISEINDRKILSLNCEGLKDDISKINSEIQKFSKILAERENTNDSFFEETKDDKVAIL